MGSNKVLQWWPFWCLLSMLGNRSASWLRPVRQRRWFLHVCNEENSTLANSARKENVQLYRSHPGLLTWSTEWGASRRFNTYQKQSRIEMFSSAVDTKICVQRHQSCKLMDVFDAMFFNSQSFCDTPSSHVDPLEIIWLLSTVNEPKSSEQWVSQTVRPNHSLPAVEKKKQSWRT